MGNGQINESQIKWPRLWKYLLGAFFTFPVLFLLWVVFDIWALRPELSDIDTGAAMNKLRWFGIPLIAVTTLFGGKWLIDVHAANGREHEWQQKNDTLKIKMLAQKNQNTLDVNTCLKC